MLNATRADDADINSDDADVNADDADDADANADDEDKIGVLTVFMQKKASFHHLSAMH